MAFLLPPCAQTFYQQRRWDHLSAWLDQQPVTADSPRWAAQAVLQLARRRERGSARRCKWYQQALPRLTDALQRHCPLSHPAWVRSWTTDVGNTAWASALARLGVGFQGTAAEGGEVRLGALLSNADETYHGILDGLGVPWPAAPELAVSSSFRQGAASTLAVLVMRSNDRALACLLERWADRLPLPVEPSTELAKQAFQIWWLRRKPLDTGELIAKEQAALDRATGVVRALAAHGITLSREACLTFIEDLTLAHRVNPFMNPFQQVQLEPSLIATADLFVALGLQARLERQKGSPIARRAEEAVPAAARPRARL